MEFNPKTLFYFSYLYKALAYLILELDISYVAKTTEWKFEWMRDTIQSQNLMESTIATASPLIRFPCIHSNPKLYNAM